MDNIKWEEGAVCFANGKYLFINTNSANPSFKFRDESGTCFYDDIDNAVTSSNFQLNEIRQGDYIEASELDTEQKYNDAVEVFELFGYKPHKDHGGYAGMVRYWRGVEVYKGELVNTNATDGRKLTYPQLMAIGKLKRAMIERDESNASELPNSCEGEWTDKHYDNFYQLTEEDIKACKIKVDAYFVNRMWKINQWDDTGAGFHILKTLPRIANNKNSLKRELVALKKQISILCKLHGVDDDTN